MNVTHGPNLNVLLATTQKRYVGRTAKLFHEENRRPQKAKADGDP